MKKLILLLLIPLSACNVQQRRLNKAIAVMRANTGELAKLCSEEFKPETLRVSKTDTLLTTDTVYSKVDSVPCPAVAPGKVVYVKCPPASVITKTIRLRDTVTITSPARERVITDSLIIYKERYKDAKNTATKRGRTIWWLAGGLVLVVGAGVARFFLKR